MVARVLLYGSSAWVAHHILRLARKYWKWYFSPLWSLPGPDEHRNFVFGAFPTILKEPFMDPHLRWWKKADQETTDMIHYSTLLGYPSVLFLNADHVKSLLLSNHRLPRFIKNFRSLEAILPNGLVTLEGESWHRHRRIIHPSFQEKYLKTNLSNSVPSHVQTLLDCWKEAGPERAIDLFTHFSMLTLDVLGDIAFAHNFDGLSSIRQWSSTNSTDAEVPPVADRVIASLNASLKPTALRYLLSIFGLRFLDLENRRTQRDLNEAVDEIVRNARDRCEQRKAASSNEAMHANGRKSTSKYEAKSVLELMLDAKDLEATDTKQARTLDDTELRNEVKTFLVAGHETTSTWCYWAVYCLCKFPEIQERVYEDIMKHLPPSDGGDAPVELETIEKMTYFDAFLKEVLRLYPPAGFLIRCPIENEVIGDITFTYPTRLVVPVFLLHRSPRYWKDPLVFQPERWLSEEAPYSHPYAYLPFSSGPRNCIGNRFATMEAKLIMARVLRQVRFQLTPEIQDAEIKLTSYITLKSKPAIQVNAIFREEASVK